MSVVLVVDNDLRSCDLLTTQFKRELMEVRTVRDGLSALSAVTVDEPDVVIMDVDLPGPDGYEVCRLIRARSDVPILFLSNRADETSRLTGLAVGGDDYVTKPFSAKEVAARTRTILRRARGTSPRPSRRLTLGNLSLGLESRQASVAGAPVYLTRREFDIMALLLSRPGKVYGREEILCHVWGVTGDATPSRAVDGHVKLIRRKLSAAGLVECAIETVLGVGYRAVGS